MGCCNIIVFLWIICLFIIRAENSTTFHNDVIPEISSEGFDLEAYKARLDNQTISFEKELKKVMKDAIKMVLPHVMSFNGETNISSSCLRSLMKFISGMTSVKVWALRMLDASTKFPPGFMSGTLSDFGAFDQCLDIELPKQRDGSGIEFRGRYCAVEVTPILPPAPRHISMAKQLQAQPLDSARDEMRHAGMAFFYLKVRLGLCVPSACTLNDVRNIAEEVGGRIEMNVKVPQCYIKENVILKPVHIAVICSLSLLLVACIFGTVTEYHLMRVPAVNKQLSILQKISYCFSLIFNFNRLTCASKGSEELKVLHGLRALSMAWVMLGHTYIWFNFQLLSGTNKIVDTFNDWSFGPLVNAWLSVEPFFFLSGLLTCYSGMKFLPQTKGKINVPIYILRRYIRLTPPLLLVMGLVFFLPLLSSGPFWYERIDPELKACSQNWWTNILYFSNWTGMKNICVHPSWYLAVDFQLHLVSLIVLFILYRSTRIGMSLIAAIVAVCSTIVGVLTYQKDLPPTAAVTSGNDQKIQEIVDYIHVGTYTHAGPYYIGFIVGFLMVKFKGIKICKIKLIIGWCLSIVFALTSVYGPHRWNIGEPHGPLLTSIYAAFHRTTFIIGIAWVSFVCVSGYGGIVNKFLSCSLFAPLSRLTFMTYLLHSLVLWVRTASRRERIFYSQYNILYEYAGNVVFSIFLTVPFYLLLEAPLANLERLVFSRAKQEQQIPACQVPNGITKENIENGTISPKNEVVIPTPIELKSIKTIDLGSSNFYA